MVPILVSVNALAGLWVAITMPVTSTTTATMDDSFDLRIAILPRLDTLPYEGMPKANLLHEAERSTSRGSDAIQLNQLRGGDLEPLRAVQPHTPTDGEEGVGEAPERTMPLDGRAASV